MNKWYKSGLTKGILIVLQQVMVVLVVVSLVWIVIYPGLAQDILSGEKARTYEDSEGFSNQVFLDSQHILAYIRHKDMLETEGKLDEKKIVDIEEFYTKGTISNANSGGLAYYLGDLNKWYEAYQNGEMEEYNGQGSPVIVCQKADNTYQYYLFSEFKTLIESGELSFVTENDRSTGEILDRLSQGGYYGTGSADFSAVVDADGQVQYLDCWNYDGEWLQESYTPIDADSILTVVNENPKWNGRLSEAFTQVRSVMSTMWSMTNDYQENQNRWQEGDTNLQYIYADLDAGTIHTNQEALRDYNKIEANIEKIKALGSYTIVKPKLADFSTNMKGLKAEMWKQEVKNVGTAQEDFIYAVGVDNKFPIEDEYHNQQELFEKYAPSIRTVVMMGIAAIIIFLISMVWLTTAAGRSSKDEDIHLHPFDRWKTEIAVAAVSLGWLGPMMMLGFGWNHTWRPAVTENSDVYYSQTLNLDVFDSVPQILMFSFIGVFTSIMFLIGFLSLVRRIKAGTLWKNSLLRWFLKFFGELFTHMHSVWKTVLLLCGFVLLHWIVLTGMDTAFWVLLMLAADVAALVYLVNHAIGRRKIRIGIERIAGGEVNYKIPTASLKGEQLIIAERINAIGEGLDAAVEASMKNERLKTDLITNVSHDIKTPLTSIINYVDLLKRENFTDPKILGYLDVLEAKAQRLKTLTEDVVEASKVSSGNITLEYMNINLVEMIQQTSGEFEEKFKRRNLTEVLTLPDEEAVIRVDGRRMWRVLENIYNNAAKYAMEGSRIYGDLSVTQDKVIFSLKNVSQQPLNINADELTERFIRGDVSRSTEGSGLGLSIAKSLTTMQSGEFDIYVDGDLFKVTVTFPRMVKAD